MASMRRTIGRRGFQHAPRPRGWLTAGTRGESWFTNELQRRLHLFTTRGVTNFGRMAR